jgi:hypothetical protein
VREREGERKRQEETNRRRSRWIQAAAVILRRAAVASGRERARLRERSRSAGESSVLAEDKVLHVGPTGCNFAKKKQSAADKSLGLLHIDALLSFPLPVYVEIRSMGRAI